MRPAELKARANFVARAGGLLCALTTALIVLGALVRAFDAGLACPDWPLCFGEVIPQFNLQVAFEWSHRVLAGGVALLFAALFWRAWRLPQLRAHLLFAAALLALQIFLGALTVWQLLAEWTVTSHLLCGNAFNAALLLLALRAKARYSAPPQKLAIAAAASRALSPAQRAWLFACAALLGLQFVLGGLVASGYAGLACPQWPACNGGEWFPAWGGAVGLHIFHRLCGYALLATFAAAAFALRGARGGRAVLGAALLCFAQVLAGAANVLLRLPEWLTALHSLLAALLVLLLCAALHAAFARPAAVEEKG